MGRRAACCAVCCVCLSVHVCSRTLIDFAHLKSNLTALIAASLLSASPGSCAPMPSGLTSDTFFEEKFCRVDRGVPTGALATNWGWEEGACRIAALIWATLRASTLETQQDGESTGEEV